MSRLLSTYWWNDPLSGVYLLTLANVRYLSLVLSPTNLVLNPFCLFSNTSLNCSPNPTFLGVTFDQTLSFKHHVLSLLMKFHSQFRAFRSIASAFWGPSKESLCTLYKVFILPILIYASPGWFSFFTPHTSVDLCGQNAQILL